MHALSRLSRCILKSTCAIYGRVHARQHGSKIGRSSVCNIQSHVLHASRINGRSMPAHSDDHVTVRREPCTNGGTYQTSRANDEDAHPGPTRVGAAIPWEAIDRDRTPAD